MALAQTGDRCLAERVREVVDRTMSQREPTIAAVAAAMRMSARTLQRRLSDNGIRFNLLVDQVRREAAEAHLARGSVNFVELAFLLGFSDPNSFFRAFKKMDRHDAEPLPQPCRRSAIPPRGDPLDLV